MAPTRYLARLFALAVALAAAGARPASPEGLDPRGEMRLVDLSIAMEPESRALLEKTLLDVSDPSRLRYGKHLTRDEAKSLLRPCPESVRAVRRWLSEAGVPDGRVRHRGLLVHAQVAVEHAERLLSTRLGPQRRAHSVPAKLRGHVVAIQATALPQIESAPKRAPHGPPLKDQVLEPHQDSQQTCNGTNTPACLRKLYNMTGAYARPHKKSLFGVAGFDQQAAQHDQLDAFLRRFARYAVGANFSTELINGGQNPQGEYPSGEANLDIQYAVAMAYKVPVRYYAVGGENHDFIPDLDISDPDKEFIEPWLPFVSHLLDLDDDQLPQVLSISYGVNEQAVPRAYAKLVCDMFGQLGTRGVSVIVASGDTGPGLSCLSNDGTKTTKFLPPFPATCPYVTSVGATEGIAPEVAVNYSSGGFSEYWPRPAWQDEAVGRYLDRLGTQWRGYYNPGGRAIPDVAAQGIQYPIINHGKVEMTGGTSASAPVFASMVALLNDGRFERGRPPMGFLNPWLYSVGHAGFTDITRGRSHGCAGISYGGGPAPHIAGAGWDAVPGWDPVTGWGTPRFDRLQRLACR